jgi:hypothetical protein
MDERADQPEKQTKTGQVCPCGSVTEIANDVIVAAATPSSIQARSFVPRRRFQKGNLIIRGKTPTRYGMYREDVLQSDGTFKRLRRCVYLGPASSLSERSARKMFQPYLDRVNAAAKLPPQSGVTLEEFVKEWRASVASDVVRDKYEGSPKLRGTSQQRSVAQNGGKCAADSIFNFTDGENLGLCLWPLFARRHYPAARDREKRAAFVH